MDDKVVIITGAGGELGRPTVDVFLKKGCQVIAVTRSGKAHGFSPHKRLSVVPLDLLDEAATESFIKDVVEKHRKVDAVLLLAGGFAMGGLSETNRQSLNEMYSLNFETAYSVARFAFNQMLTQKSGGRIIFIGSKPSLETKAAKGKLAYSLSKSLLLKLSDYINEEGASKNVVSYVVAPGTIDTLTNRQSMPSSDFSKWVSADEIAEFLAFLSSSPGNKLRDGVFRIYGES